MKILFFIITITFSSMCFANWNPADEDLENCIWRDGHKISEKNCNEFRQEVKREGLKPTKQMLEERATADKERQDNWIVRQKAEQERKIQDEEHKKKTEREWRENNAREEAETVHYREQLARDEARDEAAKKLKCGKDFGQLRVGMTLERIDQCYEEPAYITDTVGKGGVVETYRGTFYFIYVQNGRVIGYTRRTR